MMLTLTDIINSDKRVHRFSGIKCTYKSSLSRETKNTNNVQLNSFCQTYIKFLKQNNDTKMLVDAL